MASKKRAKKANKTSGKSKINPRFKKTYLFLNKNLAKTLLITGVIIFLIGLFTKTEIYFKLKMSQTETPHIETSTKLPASLSIPNQNVNVQIDEGGIVAGEWVLSSSNALYLPTSGQLGEGFNTIIYAHNTKILFGGLNFVQKDDEIIVKDKAGKIYKYKVFQVEKVDPTDLKKLYSTEKNILTLFTCSGWADTTRTLVRAKLTDSSK